VNRGGERTGERVGEAEAARIDAAKLLRVGDAEAKRRAAALGLVMIGLRRERADGLVSRFSNLIVASNAAACAFERLAAATLAKSRPGLRLRERIALNPPPDPTVAPGS